MNNLSDLEKKYEELGKEIEALKSRSKKLAVMGYKMYGDGTCSGMELRTQEYAEEGALWPTRSSATKQGERMTVFNLLHRWAYELNGGWDSSLDGHSSGHSVSVSECGQICIDDWTTYSFGGARFKTEELALEAVELIGKDRIVKAYLS